MQNKMYRLLAAVMCIGILCMPVCAYASDAITDSTTWGEILLMYPGRPVTTLIGDLKKHSQYNWEQALQELMDQGMDSVRLFDSDWQPILSITPETRMCTGQHGCFFFSGYEDGVRLCNVVVRGDVLGNGDLTIAQVVRLSRAITGADRLHGLYLEAADVNGSGGVDIADLTLLASWLAS